MPVIIKGSKQARVAPNLYNAVGNLRVFVRGVDPWAPIDKDVASLLKSAGVTTGVDTRLGIGNIGGGVAGGGYGVTGATAQFNPMTNAVTYNPTVGGLTGNLQHEMTHAYVQNTPGLYTTQGLSIDERLRAIYLRNNFLAMRGEGFYGGGPTIPGTSFHFRQIPAAAGLAIQPRSGTGQPMWFESINEGIADRSGAYTYPRWGEAIRRRVVPHPVDNPYTYP